MSNQIGMPVPEAAWAIVGLSNVQTSVSTMLATQDTAYKLAHLPHLSNELKMMILSQLSQKDLLLGVAQTCKGLQEICYFLGYYKVNIQLGSSTLLWGDINWIAHSGMPHIRHIEMHLTRRTNHFQAAADDIILKGFVESLPVGLLSFRVYSGNHVPRGISPALLRTLSRTQSHLQVLEFPVFDCQTGDSAFDQVMTTSELPEVERLAITTCSIRSVANLWGPSVINLPKLKEMHITVSSLCQHGSSRPHAPRMSIGDKSSIMLLITRLTMQGLKLNHRLRQKLPSLRALQLIECIEIDAFVSTAYENVFPNLTAFMIRSNEFVPDMSNYLRKISHLKELFLEVEGMYGALHQPLLDNANALELLVWTPVIHQIASDSIPDDLCDWIPYCPNISFLGVALPSTHRLQHVNTPGDMQDNSEALQSIRDASSLEVLFYRCELCTSTYDYDQPNPAHAHLEEWFRDECLVHNSTIDDKSSVMPSLEFFATSHLVVEHAYPKESPPWTSLQNETKTIVALKPSLTTVKATEWKALFLRKYAARELFFLEDFADAMIEKSVAYQAQDLPM